VNTIIEAIVNPYFLLGIWVASFVAQVVSAVRQSSDGVWVAWRYALWGVAVVSLIPPVVYDLQHLTTVLPDQDAASRSRLLWWATMRWAGISLILLTISAALISGIAKIVQRRRSAKAASPIPQHLA
jgi:hypothetical protein